MRARLILSGLICLCSSAHGEVDFDWATIGNAGNPPSMDPGVTGPGGEGSVDYAYRISKHEVTNEQYAEFLGKVALDDPLELFYPEMQITRTGTSGSFGYAASPGFERHPVTHVRFLDAMRFVNWLENGQGTGGTESGTYTIGTGANETRAPNANYFIPNNDEWYKAAYYDPSAADETDNYWRYATQHDDFPTFEAPPGGLNSVNTAESELGSTEVGAYPDSTSFYGTFDQTGNAAEWTEALSGDTGFRCLRGPSFGDSLFFIRYCYRPEARLNGGGFRVASVSVPSGDCNADGVVNAADLSCVSSIEGRDVVLDALNTLPGDLDGNGEVAFADFVVLSQNFGLDLPSYADGNIDLKNGVAFEDFQVLADNFAKTSSHVAAVPEPSVLSLLCLCLSFATFVRDSRNLRRVGF